jgi:hypothetical protein
MAEQVKITEFQSRCVNALKKYGTLSTTEIAVAIKSNRLAANSAMRSLVGKGLAQQYVHTSYGTENQPGTQMWALTAAADAIAAREGME